MWRLSRLPRTARCSRSKINTVASHLHQPNYNLSSPLSSANRVRTMTSAAVDSYLTTSTSSDSPSVPFSSSQLWTSARPKNESKPGEARVFYNVDGKGAVGAVVSLGTAAEQAAQAKKNEAVRKAIGTGVKKLKEAGAKSIAVDVSSVDPQAAAEGAALSLYKFSLKTSKVGGSEADPQKDVVEIQPTGQADAKAWETGLVHAYGQNLARELMELPANLMTPTIFCERISKELEGLDNVEVFVRDAAWAEEKGMRTFLSVAKGTDEPAKLLEVHYKGAADKSATPVGLVGKGITFDSGGISLKPSANMKLMRGDMGGAATVMSSLVTIAKLKLPINIVAVTPLSENLPGPSANKPGDIIYAMNGKTVEVDNTDAEGRLVLSDALYYVSSTFKPKIVIDVATLTGAMVIALGQEYTGVFTNSDELWKKLDAAGETTQDKMWRMPLDDEYMHLINGSNADLCNTGGRSAGSCTAALFLKHFVEGVEGDDPTTQWAHLDMAGTMESVRADPYQGKGMTGRPVRALVEFARQQATS